MRCPKCGEPLTVRHKLDVEIDACPQGHGVWLDSGEVDKLAERESSGWLSRFLGRAD
ncbi:MAG: zf-TFIIB domain-containing protein [Deltaproteobacteria bacterium]|nr:zf-TFIIB domain-containing protein [Deltaproteobacteria bacterium]